MSAMYQDPGFGEYRLGDLRAGQQPILVASTKSPEALSGETEGAPMARGHWSNKQGSSVAQGHGGINTNEDPYDVNTNLPNALKIIEEAVEGEAKMRGLYQYLTGMAQGRDKEILSGMMDDGIKRYELFRRIYYEITNDILSPSNGIILEKPASYRAGLQAALMEEQEAVKQYRSVQFAMRGARHINMLTEIITDGLRHLALYNYLYTNAYSGRL